MDNGTLQLLERIHPMMMKLLEPWNGLVFVEPFIPDPFEARQPCTTIT